MSYNNFSNINPLIAVYENNSRTTTSSTPYFKIDTSLYSGSVSSETLTLDYPCTLRGDFYGSTNVTTSLTVYSQFYVDGSGQHQSFDKNAGSGGGNNGGPEPFFANAPKNVNIQARYRRATASALNVVTSAKFPRITGVLIQ